MPSVFVPIRERYQARFGQRVQILPVQIAQTCPNRMGLKGMQTCIFCDEWGAAAYSDAPADLDTQIVSLREKLGARYASGRFLVYFQAYTSGFLSVKKIEAYFEKALSHEGVVGIVLGTRPDCIPPALIELCQRISDKAYIAIELGIQTFSDTQLAFLRRGHDNQASIDAIRRIKTAPNVDLGIHLIFGLPGETDEDVVHAAKTLADLPVDHVKLHNLHVLKNTPLEGLYQQGEFQPLELEAYADRVSLFLKHLPRRIAVQRLAAVSSRWDELVAPEWTRHKMKTVQFIVDRMTERGEFQGQAVG